LEGNVSHKDDSNITEHKYNLAQHSAIMQICYGLKQTTTQEKVAETRHKE